MFSTVYTGEWVDKDMSGLPDAGEEIAYTIVVTNLGTVTLTNVETTSQGDEVTCDGVDQPVAVLGVGDTHRCKAYHLVRSAVVMAVIKTMVGLDPFMLSGFG